MLTLMDSLERSFLRSIVSQLHHARCAGGCGTERAIRTVFFVANHLSYLDQSAIMFALPPKLRYTCATAAWAEFFFGEYHGADRIWRRLCYEFGTVLLNLSKTGPGDGYLWRAVAVSH